MASQKRRLSYNPGHYLKWEEVYDSFSELRKYMDYLEQCGLRECLSFDGPTDVTALHELACTHQTVMDGDVVKTITATVRGRDLVVTRDDVCDALHLLDEKAKLPQIAVGEVLKELGFSTTYEKGVIYPKFFPEPIQFLIRVLFRGLVAKTSCLNRISQEHLRMIYCVVTRQALDWPQIIFGRMAHTLGVAKKSRRRSMPKVEYGRFWTMIFFHTWDTTVFLRTGSQTMDAYCIDIESIKWGQTQRRSQTTSVPSVRSERPSRRAPTGYTPDPVDVHGFLPPQVTERVQGWDITEKGEPSSETTEAWVPKLDREALRNLALVRTESEPDGVKKVIHWALESKQLVGVPPGSPEHIPEPGSDDSVCPTTLAPALFSQAAASTSTVTPSECLPALFSTSVQSPLVCTPPIVVESPGVSLSIASTIATYTPLPGSPRHSSSTDVDILDVPSPLRPPSIPPLAVASFPSSSNLVESISPLSPAISSAPVPVSSATLSLTDPIPSTSLFSTLTFVDATSTTSSLLATTVPISVLPSSSLDVTDILHLPPPSPSSLPTSLPSSFPSLNVPLSLTPPTVSPASPSVERDPSRGKTPVTDDTDPPAASTIDPSLASTSPPHIPSLSPELPTRLEARQEVAAHAQAESAARKGERLTVIKESGASPAEISSDTGSRKRKADELLADLAKRTAGHQHTLTGLPSNEVYEARIALKWPSHLPREGEPELYEFPACAMIKATSQTQLDEQNKAVHDWKEKTVEALRFWITLPPPLPPLKKTPGYQARVAEYKKLLPLAKNRNARIQELGSVLRVVGCEDVLLKAL